MLRFVSKQHTAFLAATLVMFIVFVCLVTGGKTSESCGHIRLSNMPQKKQFVSVEEHSSFSLPFRVDTSNCPENNDQHFHIYVTRPASGGDICVVGVTREGCTSTNKDLCHCMEVDGYRGAVFTKILTMEDSGTWVWRIGGGERKEVEFMIRRLDSPRITELSIQADSGTEVTERPVTIDINTMLQVTCKWKNGNMDAFDPGNVQLLDAKGAALDVVERNDTGIRAELIARCEDAGNVTCIVPGARYHVSVELVVLCSSSEVEAVEVEAVEVEAVASIAAIVVVVIGVVVVVCVRKRRGQPRLSATGNPDDVTTPSRRQIPSTTGRQNDYEVVGNLTTTDYDVLYRAPTAVDEDGYLIVMASSQHDTTGDDYSIVV